MRTGRSLKAWTLGLATVFLVAGQAGAQGNTTVVEEILNILRQNGTISEEQKKMLLERAAQEQIRAAEERAKDKAQMEKDRMAALIAGVEKGKPYLKSADGDFRFELDGRVYLDYDVAEGDAKALTGPDLADRFLVRAARLGVTGQLYKWIDLKIEADFTQAITLKDGYIDFRFMPGLALRAGQFKTPFSQEELTSSRFIDFVDRSVLNELAPARDAGAMLHGQFFDGILSYAVGVFNGAGENGVDNSDGKDAVGRVVIAPFKPTKNYWLKGLQVAGDMTYGDQDSSASAQGRNVARTNPRFTFFTAQPARGDRERLGAELYWPIGPGSLKFEWAQQRNERIHLGSGGADLADVYATAWFVTGTFILTGEDKPLAGPVIPKRPFNPLAKEFGMGAWELALRYSELFFESDSPVDFFDGNIGNGITGGGVTAENGVRVITAGVNWYLNPRVRYMLNWSHYEYDNDLGTPFSCKAGLATCSAATLAPGGDYWEILNRVQFWF
jgi:phosphate-selective porin OprO/OprP